MDHLRLVRRLEPTNNDEKGKTMQEITVKLYAYDELSDEAKARAHDDYLNEQLGSWCPCLDGLRDEMEEALRAFEVDVPFAKCNSDSYDRAHFEPVTFWEIDGDFTAAPTSCGNWVSEDVCCAWKKAMTPTRRASVAFAAYALEQLEQLEQLDDAPRFACYDVIAAQTVICDVFNDALDEVARTLTDDWEAESNYLLYGDGFADSCEYNDWAFTADGRFYGTEAEAVEAFEKITPEDLRREYGAPAEAWLYVGDDAGRTSLERVSTEPEGLEWHEAVQQAADEWADTVASLHEWAADFDLSSAWHDYQDVTVKPSAYYDGYYFEPLEQTELNELLQAHDITEEGDRD